MKNLGPNHYRNLAEFTREVISPHMKAGWSLADLYSDATYNPGRDDSLVDDGPKELDFDFG